MDRVMEKIRELIRQINARIREVGDALNRVLARVPGFLRWAVEKIHEGWNMLLGKLQEFWDMMSQFLSNAGDPAGLSQAANDWATSVGGPVSSESSSVEAGQLSADDTWTGMSADKYKEILPEQKAAMAATKSNFADGISSQLDSAHTAIIIFWCCVAAALVTLAFALLGAIAEASSVVGSVAVPPTVSEAVVVALVAIAAGASHLRAACESAKSLLTQKMNDLAAFPGGAWPKAVL